MKTTAWTEDGKDRMEMGGLVKPERLVDKPVDSLVTRLRAEQPYENDIKYEAADAIEELVGALDDIIPLAEWDGLQTHDEQEIRDAKMIVAKYKGGA